MKENSVKNGNVSSMLYKYEHECCGCAACYSICPRHAIAMTENAGGFEYPVIDEKLCVGCELCISVCPIKLKEKTGN